MRRLALCLLCFLLLPFSQETAYAGNNPNYNGAFSSFKWNMQNETSGPVEKYVFLESSKQLGTLEFTTSYDWTRLKKAGYDGVGTCYSSQLQLQFQSASGWMIEKELSRFRPTHWYGPCLEPDDTRELSGDLSIYPLGLDDKWLNETRNYRIWDVQQSEEMANFTVTFVPDPNAKPFVQPKVAVAFPSIVEYGKSYTVVATVTPKFNGVCRFYLYYMGDIPVGNSKIVNGKATLKFRVLWPKNSSPRKSIKAVCSNSKYNVTGGTLFIGTNP